ncbi:hypothetical protein PGQ11_003543 [Apiospora arundinis]|uniref:RING-type domain-containing protein n=1 Tax=Apiospora arundinis TaxID=335852 RepID=A0ABR2J5T3_9PEZI
MAVHSFVLIFVWNTIKSFFSLQIEEIQMKCALCPNQLRWETYGLVVLPCQHNFHIECLAQLCEQPPVMQMGCPVCTARNLAGARGSIEAFLAAGLLKNPRVLPVINSAPAAMEPYRKWEIGQWQLGSHQQLHVEKDLNAFCKELGDIFDYALNDVLEYVYSPRAPHLVALRRTSFEGQVNNHRDDLRKCILQYASRLWVLSEWMSRDWPKQPLWRRIS